MKVHKAEAIRRKPEDSIPNPDQTAARKEVADMIEDEILARNDWPMSLTAISEMTKTHCSKQYSRQHVTNTINSYFEIDTEHLRELGLGELDGIRGADGRLKVDIDIPNDVDAPSYVRGYITRLLEEER